MSPAMEPPKWAAKAAKAEWVSFPVWTDTVHVAYRISAMGPCYFNRDGTFRFDPPAGRRDDYGVSYWALDPAAAFIEKWGDYSMGIPQSLIRTTSLSEWSPPRARRYAGLITDGTILGDFGIDLAISHSSRGDYERSQGCGSYLQSAGFDGIVWTLRHDPQGDLRGLALFGPAHPADEDRPALFPGVKSAHVPNALIRECERRFSLRVLPGVPLP